MSYTQARLGAAELPGEFPSLPCGSPRLLVPPSTCLTALKGRACRSGWLVIQKDRSEKPMKTSGLFDFVLFVLFLEDTLVERGSELRVLRLESCSLI